MKTRDRYIKLRPLAILVSGLLAAMCAMPARADDDAEVAAHKALTVPTSIVEFGALDVSKSSAKFGEYTGMNKSGGYLIGNIDIRGGNAYGDGGGTTRWSITGNDLGLTSRSFGAAVSNQGRWNFGINFDELRHFTSDSYQTPFQGSMGGNTFTLPGFGAVTGTNTRTGLSAAQLGAFHTVDINNTRENTSLTGGVILNDQWAIKVDFNHLDQSGAKLQGFGSAGIGGVTGERISILPMPTNFKTDNLNAALNWVGEKGYATASYFGSFFRDANNGFQFATWTTATNPLQTASTQPSNNFNQLNLTGGYAFSSSTRLAGGLSYGRNTQNATYSGNFDAGMMTTPPPVGSLNGLVVTTHADLKLTNQATRNLGLSAAIKYDDRDNRTASNAYNFHAIDGLGHDAFYPNPAYHIRKTQIEFAGDYRFSASQKFRLSYNHDQIDRKCDSYAVIPPSIINGNLNTYPAGTNCLTATNTKEDKLGAAWRYKAAEGVNLNAGYTYSDRRTSFDQNAIAPFIGVDGNPNLLAPAATLVRGLNAAEYRGFHPFFDASRTQQMVKAGANWQATDKLSLVANGRFAIDDYDSTYGMQKGTTQGLNLDATYQYRDDGVASVYVTQQQRTRDMTNLQNGRAAVAATATAVAVPSGATWTNKMKDRDTTIGFTLKQTGLMKGKLDLVGDITYSLGKTSYNTALNYFTTTTGGLTCADPTIFTCVALPDIRSTMSQFKLTGNYRIDKTAKVSVGYLYRRLRNDDFYYNGLQNGFTPTSVLPTNQQAPNYNVNVVWASYTYSFQ